MMYYYNGKKIGIKKDATDWLLTHAPDIVKDLVCEWMNEIYEEPMEDLVWDLLNGSYRGWQERDFVYAALTYLADVWLDMGGWNQPRGTEANLDVISYEDWEELE